MGSIPLGPTMLEDDNICVYCHAIEGRKAYYNTISMRQAYIYYCDGCLKTINSHNDNQYSRYQITVWIPKLFNIIFK